MAIAVTTVELEKNNIVANVPIDCAMPVFDEGHIFVYFNKIRTLAVQGVDYDIVLNDPTYDDFDIIPTTALLLKINAQITLDPTDENVIFVRRELPLTNDFQETDAFFRAKLTDEIDRLTMTDQQLDDRLDNVEFTGADAAAILAAKTAAEVAAAAALVSETNAATSEGNAATSESNAAASAGTATTQAGIATGAASTATTQAGIATTAAGDATAAFDSFDDRYLGAKITNPSTDNDGDPLTVGAVYWNSVANEMRVWNGAAWVLALAAQGFATEGYADAAANDALIAANAYTDGEVASTLAAANGYTDGQVSALTAVVNTKADKSIQITGSGLIVGGGDLTADRTLEVVVATQAQAEEGLSNDVGMTPLRTKQAINVLGVSALTGVQMAMQLADLSNQVLFLGPNGAGAYDSYDTTTYLDLVNSINLDTSTPGIIKPAAEQATGTLLLHFDGANNSTTFVDSIAGKTVTPVGDAKIVTAQSKFGGSSGFFDGTGDTLTIASHVDFALGTGDFTIEFFVRFNSLAVAVQSLFTMNITAGLLLFKSGASTLSVSQVGSGTNLLVNWTPVTDQWYHIACCRASGVQKLFADGIELGSASVPANYAQGPVHIGSNAGANHFNGWMDELQFTKGVAKYSGNFTPPLAPYYGSYLEPALGATIGNMNTQGNVFDGDIATSASTTGQGVAGYVGKTWTSPKKISSAIVRPRTFGWDGTTNTATITVALYAKNGAAPANPTDGTLLATTTFQEVGAGSAGDKTLISSDTSTLWDHTWVRVIDNIDVAFIAELSFFGVGSATAMTALSKAYTATVPPSKVKGFITVKPIDAVVLNTDLFVDYSRDNGTTWTQAVSTDLLTDPVNGFHLIETNEVNVSGQPSGTQIRYRTRTPTAKRIEGGDAAIYWRQ